MIKPSRNPCMFARCWRMFRYAGREETSESWTSIHPNHFNTRVRKVTKKQNLAHFPKGNGQECVANGWTLLSSLFSVATSLHVCTYLSCGESLGHRVVLSCCWSPGIYRYHSGFSASCSLYSHHTWTGANHQMLVSYIQIPVQNNNSSNNFSRSI